MAKIKLKTILKCTRCPATADISKNPNALNGWAVYPKVVCADCIDRIMQQRMEAAQKQAERLQVALALVESGQL